MRYTNGQEMFIKKEEEEEFRSSLIAHHFPAWADVIAAVRHAFEYINNRLTDACAVPYHCAAQHECFNSIKVFDPSAVASIGPNESYVNSMFPAIPFLRSRPSLAAGMNAEVADYMKLAEQFQLPAEAIPGKDDFMKAFTKSVLGFWAANAKKIPSWSMAARLVFAVQPNSAECERVFSILTRVFGQQRERCLADEISASLMQHKLCSSTTKDLLAKMVYKIYTVFIINSYFLISLTKYCNCISIAPQARKIVDKLQLIAFFYTIIH